MMRLTDLQDRLAPLLSPVAAAYGAVMRLRSVAYDRGLLTRHEAGRPCVSVGNIGWGGSGKTPLAGWLLDWAVTRGLRPALLTRGYKASPPHLPYRVAPDSPWTEAGDEPALLAAAQPRALVLVDPQRSRAAAWACAHEPPDLFVLDDGLQHLALRRDADLVLLKPADLGKHWDRVIPAGPWREPASALGRASAFLVKSSSLEILELCKTRLESFGKPVFTFAYALARVRPVVPGGADLEPKSLQGVPYVLATGVADPAAVREQVSRWCGGPPAEHLAFADHHAFTPADWNAIAAAMALSGARRALCTAKDAVKLRDLADERLWALDTRVVFGPSLFTTRSFPDWWSEVWTTLQQGYHYV